MPMNLTGDHHTMMHKRQAPENNTGFRQAPLSGRMDTASPAWHTQNKIKSSARHSHSNSAPATSAELQQGAPLDLPRGHPAVTEQGCARSIIPEVTHTTPPLQQFV